MTRGPFHTGMGVTSDILVGTRQMTSCIKSCFMKSFARLITASHHLKEWHDNSTNEMVCNVVINIDKLVQNVKPHNCNTCQSSDLPILFCGSSVIKKWVVDIGIELCNKLPN